MESSEHRFIGNHAQVSAGLGVSFTAEGFVQLTLRAPQMSDVSLTYGEVVALGGDFYGTPTLKPISSGLTIDEQVQRFEDAFGTLATANRVELATIMKILDVESSKVIGAQHPAKVFQEELGTKLYCQWNEATGGAPASQGIAGMATGPGRYTSLAIQNLDHFGSGGVAAYHAGHLAACRKASTDLNTALAMNAFADHFLTDLFAAGHIRTPRKVLNEYSWNLSGVVADKTTVGSLLSRAMHDEENRTGLTVTSQARGGGTWLAYGDQQALEKKAEENTGEAITAVQASIDEVLACQSTPDPKPAFGALQHIPNVAGDYPPTGGPSIAPMFVAQGSEPLARTAYFPFTSIPSPGLGSVDDYHYTKEFLWEHVVGETLGSQFIPELAQGIFVWLGR